MVKKLIIILSAVFSSYITAQTTGPTQPEVSSFPSISGNGMVDLYTGDLNYNIPLLVVPGPDGGYSIDLGYTASASVNNVPTWVGYNWNINMGAIVRNKRGIPDDFRGDTETPDLLKKTVYLKDKWNIGIPIGSIAGETEIFGAELEIGGKLSAYYDNYSGFGVKAGANIAPMSESEGHKMKSEGAWNLGINFDSKSGLILSPSLSLDHLLNKKEIKHAIGKVNSKNEGSGGIINSLQGKFDKMTTFNIEHCDKSYSDNDYIISQKFKLSFAKHAPLQIIGIPRSTISSDFAFTTDLSIPILKKKFNLKGNFSISKITEPYQEIPLFGSLYTEFRDNNSKAIMDTYRDNDMPATKNTPFLPVTVNSFDVFNINASGLGGSFRLYRNEVGQYKTQFLKTTASNLEIGLDFGSSGVVFDVGTDQNFAHSNSYSGEWKNNSRINSLNKYKFTTKGVNNPLYEPAFFKLIGESYPLPVSEYHNMESDKPIAFDIGNWVDINKDPFSFKAKAFSTYNNGQNNLDVNNKNARNPRTTSIEYKIKEEVINGINRNEAIYKEKHIIKGNSLIPIDYSKGKEHHINHITVRKPNGSIYNFALPAYNTDEKNVVFATKKTPDSDRKIVEISPTPNNEDRINNEQGDDHYYSEEITPEYVHTFFLTSIQSLDYIDVKNDGFTDDDLGSWTKFMYTRVENYKWRFPFKNDEANFIDGYNENDEDNKATYTEGIKELYYVTAVETKTHIAIFSIDNSALVDANYTNPQKYLKKISLYSKSDPNYKDQFYLSPNHNLSPIKEVHFNYDYSLKSNPIGSSTIPNFNNNTPTTSENILTNSIGSSGQNGTLTLKELYFTYKKNQTGKDSRYQFEYNEKVNDTLRAFPTDYSEDRWGNYQPNIGKYKSYENPYTYQKDTKTIRNEKAGLWCLNKITLPSNGTIEIDYESDDYQYVQDKKAMEYVKVIGFGYSKNNSYVSLNSSKVDLKNSNGFADKIYLDVKSKAELEDRIRGLKYIGFKSFMHLNKIKKIDKWVAKEYKDYVSGYIENAKKDSLNKPFDVGEDANGFFIQIEAIKPTNTAQYKLHPFQVATIQYIRNFRPDLQTSFALESDPIQFARKNLNELIKAVKPLFTGYIKDKASKGWGKEIIGDKPSFLRLYTFEKKYGGNNRVRQIKLFPNPNDENIYYGKEYSYVLNDGKTSSGVAEMEPITGHEENTIVQPEFYTNQTGNKLLWVIQNETESSFVETPFGISFYPSANVGYSRVIERSLSDPNNKVNKTQDGVTISEFYTANDFPTKPNITDNPFRTIIKPINITIPFIGSLSINNGGFTQGASFTLNNGAYGKQKRISVYPYSKEEPKGLPISEVEYIYQMNSSNTLDNKVKFLKKEGDIVEAYLGKEYDFYVDQYESGSTTIGGGVKPDIKFNGPFFTPSLFPNFQYMENTSSYITTTKVIYNSPILEKTIQYKDGSKVISSPEYYDYETGNPIINSVTNEFGNKIYSYSFPGQWSYPRMKGAYKNYGAKLSITSSNNSGKFKLVQNQIASNILYEGDEIIFEDLDNKRYFVTKVDKATNDFELKDRQNNYPNINSSVYKIAKLDRSGYRNLQSVTKGSIVFLDEDNINIQEIQYTSALQSIINAYNQSQTSFQSNSMFSNEVNIPYYTDVAWYLDNSITKVIYRKINSIGRISTSQCFEDSFVINFIQTKEVDPNGNIIFNDVKKPKIHFSGSRKQCYGEIDLTGLNSNLLATIDCSKFKFTDEFVNHTSVKMVYQELGHPFNNQKVVFNFLVGENCFSCEEEERTPIPVLQANAIEFTEDFTPNFNTLPSEETDIIGESLTNIYQNNTANPYAFGVKGIPRSKRTWAYIESRKQKGTLGEGLRNDLDGEFDYYPFNRDESSVYNENYNWRWVNEITQYNANGSSEEGKNRLEMFSTNLFGYKNLLVTAAAQNAEHNDIAFDGFEDYDSSPLQAGTFITPPTYRDLNHGNLDIPLKTNSLIGGLAHTGKWSLSIENPLTIDVSNTKYFKPTQKIYIISAWVYMGDITFFNSTTSLNKGGKIEVWEGASLIASISPDRDKNNIIDGWIKIEGEFEPSTINSNIKIKLIPNQTSNGNTASIFDDIRIQPFNSTMQTYVYDPSDYTLRYILNNQNYFSEFIRDSEGSLIQKNIETEEGKKTLSINRNNISNE